MSTVEELLKVSYILSNTLRPINLVHNKFGYNNFGYHNFSHKFRNHLVYNNFSQFFPGPMLFAAKPQKGIVKG